MKEHTASYIAKWIVIISAIAGVIISALSKDEVFMGGTTVLMYFTMQSNILMAIIMAVGFVLMLQKKNTGRFAGVFKYVGTVAITLTGTVFCFILAPMMWSRAWNVQNVLTHVLVPVFSVADFFLACKEYVYKKTDVFYVLIPPLLYVIYAAVGYVRGWEFFPGINYPYFFLNWGSKAGAFGFSAELPFMGCMWWILILIMLLLSVGALYLHLLKKKTK